MMTASDKISSDPANANILLVDDDALLRRSTARLLRQAGHRVEEQPDGEAALQALSRGSYDVVLTDLQMPRLDGLELLRRIRAFDSELPVILLTGAPDLGSAVEAVELGATRYLTKPFRHEQLQEAVERAAATVRASRQLRDRVQAVRLDDATLSAALDRAIATLDLAVQPILCFSERKVFAHEALCRPIEPGLASPDRLFAAAERLERIREVGRAVRARAAQIVQQIPGYLFVNVHPIELMDDHLFAPSSPLSLVAPRIVLEITERAALDRIEQLRARVAQLRSLGFRIAVDDLGAGYAGLASLSQLEPEVVKLDMSLVRNIHLEPTQQRVVTAMLRLCRELGHSVVAEGVEVGEEARMLQSLGCDLMQGYLFGRPEKLSAAT